MIANIRNFVKAVENNLIYMWFFDIIYILSQKCDWLHSHCFILQWLFCFEVSRKIIWFISNLYPVIQIICTLLARILVCPCHFKQVPSFFAFDVHFLIYMEIDLNLNWFKLVYVINLDEYADTGTHRIALFCNKIEVI